MLRSYLSGLPFCLVALFTIGCGNGASQESSPTDDAGDNGVSDGGQAGVDAPESSTDDSGGTRVFEGTVQENVDVPLDCLPEDYTSCDQIDGTAITCFAQDSNALGTYSATCSDAGAGHCSCEVEVRFLPGLENATVRCTMETASEFKASGLYYDFCKTGDSLTIFSELTYGYDNPATITVTLCKMDCVLCARRVGSRSDVGK